VLLLMHYVLELQTLFYEDMLIQIWQVIKMLGMCYIICMCVCVGVLDTTTASDDPFT
jgi:hypothetical protein